MKKVIHVLTDCNIGGAGRWLLSELRFTDRTKFEVKVLVPEESLLRPRVEELGFALLSVPGMAERSWDKVSLAAMTELFRREKPDIVHVGASLTARIAARRAGVGVIVVTKHCAQARGSLIARVARRIVDARYADAVIAISSAVHEQLVAAGTPEEKVHIIYDGITPVAPYGAEEQEKLRGSFGFDCEHLWVGVAARLEEVKGVDLFLDAVRKILEKRADVHFAVFGEGSQGEVLRESVKDLGENVRFLGFCSEIEQAMALLDVVVVPSRSEAFCLTAAEAMSMGTPVVAFDVDGVGEVVRDGVTGLLAPAGDTDALAERIEQLLDDAALRHTLGEAGRELARQEFGAKTMVEKTEALYEALLREKGRNV